MTSPLRFVRSGAWCVGVLLVLAGCAPRTSPTTPGSPSADRPAQSTARRARPPAERAGATESAGAPTDKVATPADEGATTQATKAPAAPPADPLARPLHAGIIGDERLLLQGPAADGAFGDYVVRNAQVHAVIASPTHRPFAADRGGLLIDIGSASRRLDFLSFLTPSPLVDQRFAHIPERIEVTHDGADGTLAELVVHGRVATLESVTYETAFRLRPDDERLEIETTWRNGGAAATPTLVPYDYIFWGSFSLFIPTYGLMTITVNERVSVEGTWLAGLALIDDTSLALFSDRRAMKGNHLRNSSIVAYGYAEDEVRDVPPGGSLSLRRFLWPGREDIAPMAARIIEEQGIPSGEIAGVVVETTPEQKLVGGAEIRIDQVKRGATAAESAPRPYLRTWTNAAGEYHFRVPEGEFVVRGDEKTRLQSPRTVSQRVAAGAIIENRMQMAPPSRMSFEVRDEKTGKLIPCKITLLETRNMAYFSMGPPWEAPGSRNTYYSVAGRGVIDVPRGTYRVVISRGPEYTTYSAIHTFTAEHAVEPLALKAELDRVVDTTGWIAVDVGTHTVNSWDSLVSEEDRVIAAVAEGVELIIPTDYNTVTDLRDDIARLDLSAWISAGLGVQVRDPQRRGFGTFSIFPIFRTDEDIAAAVASLLPIADPATGFAAARREFPGSLLQVEQPLDPAYGYFARYGYDGRRDSPTYARFADGYSNDYDLLNVMTGRTTPRSEMSIQLEPWYQLILNGDYTKRFGGGSGARTIHGNETGYPRLYVRSSTDDPARVDLAEIARNIREGRVVLTTGPFVKVDLNDAGPGEWTAPREDGFVYHKVWAYAPEWVLLNTVSVDKEGYFINSAFIIDRAIPEQYPPDEARDIVRRTRPQRDWCVVATAEGLESLSPVLARLSPDPRDEPVPRAVTGPIFVDIDGDGVYTPPTPTRRHRD